jgi:hypothetical protein
LIQAHFHKRGTASTNLRPQFNFVQIEQISANYLLFLTHLKIALITKWPMLLIGWMVCWSKLAGYFFGGRISFGFPKTAK